MSGPTLPSWEASDIWSRLYAEARSPAARRAVVRLRGKAAGGEVLGAALVRLPPGLAGAALGSLRTQALLVGVTLWETLAEPVAVREEVER